MAESLVEESLRARTLAESRAIAYTNCHRFFSGATTWVVVSIVPNASDISNLRRLRRSGIE